MKTIISLLLVLIFCTALLCSCEGYMNSYAATGMVKSVWGDEATLKFLSLDGRYTFTLKGENLSDHTIEYEASLGEGKIDVYIDADSEKELLFTINGGESLDTKVSLDDKYDGVKSFRIIIDTEKTCKNGDFEFDID